MKERLLVRVLPAFSIVAALALASCGHSGPGAGTLPMSSSPAGAQSSAVSAGSALFGISQSGMSEAFLPPERFTSAAFPSVFGPNVTRLANGGVGHIMPYGGSRTLTPAVINLLKYHGGLIQKSPQQILVLWGFGTCTGALPLSCTNDPNHTTEILVHFLQNVGGAQYLTSQTQYTSTSQGHITNPLNTLTHVVVDTAAAPLHPTEQQVLNVAFGVQQFLHLSNNVNVNYVVALGHGHDPSGFKPGGFCAFHSAFTVSGKSGFQPFTDFPYVTEAGAGCGAFTVSGKNDGVSVVLGHETAEAITDPGLNAWFDINGEETGDKCANLGLNRNTTLEHSDVDPVQPLWSNSAKGCVI